MLARCPTCDELVKIVQGARRPTTWGKSYFYWPVKHTRADGKPCDGDERPI